MSNFKAVEWTRKIRNKNYTKTKNMKKNELIDFYQNKAKELKKENNKNKSS